MKKIFKLSLLAIVLTLGILVMLPNANARSYRTRSSDVYVRGYYRSNGTYVKSHYRSRADGIRSNNYVCLDYGRCR